MGDSNDCRISTISYPSITAQQTIAVISSPQSGRKPLHPTEMVPPAFRTERLSMIPKRYNFPASGSSSTVVPSLPSSSLQPVSFPGSRYSSTAKGPPGNGNGSSDNSDNKQSFQEQHKNAQKVRMNSREAAWIERQQEQRFQRPPRFAPKSRKSFQTASPYKHYGARPLMKNLRLVKDSAKYPILIPGQDVKQPLLSPAAKTKTESNHTRRRRRMLPTVDASALLDAPSYCRNSAFTATEGNENTNMNNDIISRRQGPKMNSGTEAAKRLLRGKKDLLNMLRGDIIFQESPRPFCLAGHGVPKQLLQEHINMGDSILHHFNEPAEVSLRNSDPFYPEAMKIREHDGQSRMWLWPHGTTEPHQLLQQQQQHKQKQQEDGKGIGDSIQDISQTWGERLNLYIAVMDRLASKLGFVGSCFNKEARKQWSIKVYRGMAFPVEVIAGTDVDGPVPVLEWNPLNRMSKMQPHVSIRLQGTPDLVPGANEHSMNPVTLVFDARFQEDPRLEPA